MRRQKNHLWHGLLLITISDKYFQSLDQVVAELESRFTGNDQDILCALGDVSCREPAYTAKLVAHQYELDKDILA